MSMYLPLGTYLGEMTKIIRKFFWQGTGTKKKHYMVRWPLVCRPKSKGDLGIKNIKILNICLLCKWWWRLETKNGMWQSPVRSKYNVTNGIWFIKGKQNDSPIWKDLLEVGHFYLQAGRIIVISGVRETDFWHDVWVGTISLCET